MGEAHYVFLDPDGTIGDFGLLLVVRASTGVTYAHQCGGLATEIQKAEGFPVPLHPQDQAGLKAFFDRYHGNPPMVWEKDELKELARIVACIHAFRTTADDDDTRANLTLDDGRIEELTEGWVPVISPMGAGVLVFQNSD
jgi:hypothetical protein